MNIEKTLTKLEALEYNKFIRLFEEVFVRGTSSKELWQLLSVLHFYYMKRLQSAVKSNIHFLKNMAREKVVIDGKEYYFDKVTGDLVK